MWNSNRSRCSFLFELRGTGRRTSRYASAAISAAAHADVPAAGASTPADDGHFVVRMGGVQGAHRCDGHDLLAGVYNTQFRQSVDVRRALPWGYAAAVDGGTMASNCCLHNFYGGARADSRLRPAESSTVGQNTGDHCSDLRPD